MKLKQSAIICDIDGTIAHRVDRSPFNWKEVGRDRPDDIIIEMLTVLEPAYKIVMVSGRDSICKPETEAWLDNHFAWYDALYMRDHLDNRKDSIVKQEIYEQFIKPNYQVKFVLDDRNQVVEMWRSLGLKCLQVAEGDF